MWPAAFDLWLKDKKDSKWWVAGGSSRFYRYCFFYNSFAAFPPPKQTNKKGGCCILSLVREFLPRYFKKNSGVFRPIGISEKEVKRLANFDFFSSS